MVAYVRHQWSIWIFPPPYNGTLAYDSVPSPACRGTGWVLAPWPSLSRSRFVWKVCWLVRFFSVRLRSLHKIDPQNIKCYSLQVVLTNKEIHWRCEKNTPLVGHSRTNAMNCGHHGYTRSTNRWLSADIKRVSHLAWRVENEMLSR